MALNTLFVGEKLINLSESTSTNSYAIQELSKGHLPEGTVIMAHAQTQGRGQRNNYWESAPGLNFTGSIVLYPRFLLAREQFRLNMAISIAVCNTIGMFIEDKTITIKWPNDIYVENRKIAGILIENMLKGNYIEHSVIGIGININQIDFLSDAPNPTSLKKEKEKDFSIIACFELLCSQIEAQYIRLKNNTDNNLQEEYIQKLYQFNSWHYYIVNEEKVKCSIKGVNESGRLSIQMGNGEIKTFDLKEIRFLL